MQRYARSTPLSYPLKHDLAIWKQLDLYPAARISLAERKGTLAWTVVPFSGCESTENVPFTSLKRCSILIRPSPRPVAGELLFCPYFLRISLPATILR
jgi:hypothetical protein